MFTQLDTYDLLIIIGDLMDLMSPVSKQKQIDTIKEYLEEYSKRVPVLVCSGNHDLDFESSTGELSSEWLKQLNHKFIRVDGDHYMQDGYLFSLCPWWDGPEVRTRMADMLKKHDQIDAKQRIWIHHAPPQGSRTS